MKEHFARLFARTDDLSGLPQAFLEELAPLLDRVQLCDGQRVFGREGPAGLYLVESGTLNTWRFSTESPAGRLQSVGPGMIIGEEVLAAHGPGHPRRGQRNSPKLELAEAWGETQLWVLSKDRLDQLEQLCEEERRRAATGTAAFTVQLVTDWLDRIHAVHCHSEWLVSRLRLVPYLDGLPEPMLFTLLEGAEVLHLEQGQAVSGPYQRCDVSRAKIYLVVEGQLRGTVGDEPYATLTLDPDLRPVFDTATVDDPVLFRASATGPTTVVRVRHDGILLRFKTDTAFRRRTIAGTSRDSPIGRAARAANDAEVEIVAFSRSPGLAPDLDDGTLANQLQQAICSQFDECVLLLRVMPFDWEPGIRWHEVAIEQHTGAPGVEPGEAWCCEVADRLIGACEKDDDHLDAFLARVGVSRHFDYVILDLSPAARAAASADDPVARERISLHQQDVHSWLHLADEQGSGSAATRHARSSVFSSRLRVRGGQAGAGAAGTISEPAYAEWVLECTVADDGSLRAFRPSIERLARRLTDRLVGVALGGGGALGFSHIPVLRALAERGIPVDLVSGTSFGAVVGAFYSQSGCAGLDRLLDAGKADLLTAFGSLPKVFGQPDRVQQMVDRALADIPEDDDHARLPFFPVATDVYTMAPATPRSHSAGFGVAASGAMPPSFLPPLSDDRRYIDGAFAANVPSDILLGRGAALVIASNPISRPSAFSVQDDDAVLTAIRSIGGIVRSLRVLGRTIGPFADPTQDITQLRARIIDIGRKRNGRAPTPDYDRLKLSWSLSARDVVRGVEAIAHHAGAASAERAHIVFCPETQGIWNVLSFQRDKVLAITDRSHRALGEQRIIARVEAAWSQLRQPLLYADYPRFVPPGDLPD